MIGACLVRRISTGTLARVLVGALGGNKTAALMPTTAITESFVERCSAAAPAVFGTPLLTSHWVSLSMLTNAQSSLLDPGGTKLLPIVLVGRLLETRSRLLGQLVSDGHPLSGRRRFEGCEPAIERREKG